MPLAAFGVTHQGRRSTNEDAWLVDLDLGLLVVADGMGGHNAGEVASALAVNVIREVFESSGTPPRRGASGSRGPTGQRADPGGGGRAAGAFRNGNDGRGSAHPGRRARSTRASAIAGCTCGAAAASHSSRATIRGSQRPWMAQANTPHDIGAHPMRHVLTKVVGLRPELEATVSECPLGAGRLVAPVQRWRAWCRAARVAGVDDEQSARRRRRRPERGAVCDCQGRHRQRHGRRRRASRNSFRDRRTRLTRCLPRRRARLQARALHIHPALSAVAMRRSRTARHRVVAVARTARVVPCDRATGNLRAPAPSPARQTNTVRPGSARSSAASAVMTMKTPFDAPPLWSWPVE